MKIAGNEYPFTGDYLSVKEPVQMPVGFSANTFVFQYFRRWNHEAGFLAILIFLRHYFPFSIPD